MAVTITLSYCGVVKIQVSNDLNKDVHIKYIIQVLLLSNMIASSQLIGTMKNKQQIIHDKQQIIIISIQFSGKEICVVFILYLVFKISIKPRNERVPSF